MTTDHPHDRTRSAIGPGPASQPFARVYRVWTLVHAAIAVSLVVAAEIVPHPAPVFWMLGLWIAGAMWILFVLALRRHPDGPGPLLPNVLTASRTVAAVVLMAAMALGSRSPQVRELATGSAGWWLVALLLLVELTDYLDGKLARRAGAGRFGSIWDMETDAVFALALTVVNRHLHAVGAYVLLIGLMRYLYVLLWHHETVPVSAPPIQKLFSKTTTAVLVTTLIVVLAPVIGPRFRATSLIVVLAMQVTSFAWDLWLQWRERAAASR